MALLSRMSHSLRSVNRQVFGVQARSFPRYMATGDKEDLPEFDEDLDEGMSLAGTKTYNNLREAFARKAMAMARYEYYAQKADVEGLTQAAQTLRGISNSAREQAFGHMEFLDEGDDEETDASSTEMNVETCLAHERKEFEEEYPNWAETAYGESISDVGTWMETLRNTSYNNMKTLIKLQESLEELYKEADAEEQALANNARGQPGRM